MIQVKESKEYYINSSALTFGENDLENPNRVAVSMVSGTVILVYIKGTIDYAADGNFQRWTLKGYSTKLATNNTYYIYARLDRTAPEAMIIFSPNLYALDGSIEGDEEPTPSTQYWYVRIGQLTETDGVTNRELTYDSGLLGTDKGINENNSALEEMFELNKQSTPWYIRVKHWFLNLTIRQTLTLMGNLIFGGKTLTGVATSDDLHPAEGEENYMPNNSDLATSGYVKESIKENTDNRFIRKDQEDSTKFLVKFLAGIEVGDTTGDKGAVIDALGRIVAESLKLRGDITVGREGFQAGMTGFGGYIDEYANAELESLVLRRFLEVPELRYNRVEIKVGDKWRAPGGGVIERVQPTLDAGGNPTGEGYFWLKLEDGEIGAVAVDDICMGIFHDFNNPSNNETADSDDGLGNRTFAGFCTAYWRIEEVADYSDNTGTYHNKLVKYSIRPTSDRWSRTFEPMPMMNFVCYGNFTNTERQTSVYETRTYTRMLKNQNSWNFELANVALQYGDMSNFTALGRNVSNKYSLYVGDIYMTGSLTSVDIDGQPILNVIDKGEWKEGTVAAYYERYSYNGSLWLCVNENGTNQPPSATDPSWLEQVKSGQSVTSQPNWDSSKLPYPASTILKFADAVWISNKETSEAPYPLYTDKNGNRFLFNDGGYVVAEKVQSADWDLLFDASGLVDGKDGASLEARFSADGTNWHFPYQAGDIYMQQRIGEESEWSDIIPFVGEDGAAGADGKYTDYQFAVNDSLTIAPTGGWQETPPPVGEGEYLWMRMRVIDPLSETEASWSPGVRLGGEKGEDGTSITSHGQWKSGMIVPAMGVVQMAGNSYLAKVATQNPPLWCYTDNSGSRLLFKDGGYVLTGAANTEEYDLLVVSGKDGKDGKDYEWIFQLKATADTPSKPASVQQDDHVPSGWNDDPTGVSETLPYEFACVRTKKDGLWSEYSTPAIWAKFGKDGNNAIYADMSNEMDNVALSPEGKTTREWELTTTVAIWNGQTKAELKSIAISQANGVTSSYNLSTGVITFKIASGVSIAEHNELSIVVTAHINGVDMVRTLTFTLAGVKAGANGEDAVLYDIVVSASHIVKMKDGSYSIDNISAYRNKTIGSNTQKTTDGTLKYSIDGGAETAINNDEAIQAGSISKKIQFIFYDANGVVVDKESVPVVEDGKDGEDGAGFEMMGNWASGLLVPERGVVQMAGGTYVAKVATTNPPLWCYADKSGNRYLFKDGGYILTGELNSAEYQVWVEKPKDGADGKDGKDGVDGKNTIYADITNEMDNVALSSEGMTTKAWELTTTVSMWNGQTKVGLKSISVSSVSGVTSSFNLSTGVITFKIASEVSIAEHNNFNIVVTASIDGADVARTLTFTLAGVRAGAKGEDAVLYDIIVSASQIVKMKDGSYSIANISAYRNKTIGSITQKTTDGTLKYSIDGGAEKTINNDVAIQSSTISKSIQFIFYNANGVVVDKESVPVVEDGKNGDDGKDSYTIMLTRTAEVLQCDENGNYSSISGTQAVVFKGGIKDDGWTFSAKFNDCLGSIDSTTGVVTMSSVTANKASVLISATKSGLSTLTATFTITKALAGAQGMPGMQGCILRYAEWQPGYEWRNDSDKTEDELEDVTGGIRYLDCAFVRNDAASTGWDVYRATETHVSTENNGPETDGSPWKKFDVNVPAIFTNVILANQAHIDLLQGNDIMVKKNDGTITAGMSGGTETTIGNWEEIDANIISRNIQFVFYSPDGVVADRKTVPVLSKDTGIQAVISNEMANVSLSSGGYTNNACELTTTVSMWNGVNKVTLSEIEISHISGVTTDYDLTTGEITFSIERYTSLSEISNFNINVTAKIDGVYESRTLTFTLNGIKDSAYEDAVLYDIVVSTPQIIKYEDGSYSANTIYAYRNKTVGGYTERTTEGKLVYVVDDGGIRFWAGNANKHVAPFRVNEFGESWLTNAHISGEVNATSGIFKNVSIESGTIAKFNIGTFMFGETEYGVLESSGNTTIKFTFLTDSFIRFNDPTDDVMIYARNDNGSVARFNAFGNNTKALELIGEFALNASGRSVLSSSYGNGKSNYIGGLSIGAYNPSKDLIYSNNTFDRGGKWVDFLVSNGDVTLPSAVDNPGKILFVKANGKVFASATTGGIIMANGVHDGTAYVSSDRSNLAMIYISDGNNWYEFYCG